MDMSLIFLIFLLPQLSNLLGNLGSILNPASGTNPSTVADPSTSAPAPPVGEEGYDEYLDAYQDYLGRREAEEAVTAQERAEAASSPTSDNPFDLAVGGAIVGGGLGLLGGPLAFLSVPAGAAIGAGVGFLADLFI
jgi:F0F1-type ATP synthase assembly protein I